MRPAEEVFVQNANPIVSVRPSVNQERMRNQQEPTD